MNHYQKEVLKTLGDSLKGFPLATYLQHCNQESSIFNGFNLPKRWRNLSRRGTNRWKVLCQKRSASARGALRLSTCPGKTHSCGNPRIPTLGIGGFFYSAIMYEAKRMLYAKRRLCVLWDFKERTLNALAFAGAQDIVSDTGCQCEQRRQHCREPDIEEDRLRPGAGEPGVRYLHKEDGA